MLNSLALTTNGVKAQDTALPIVSISTSANFSPSPRWLTSHIWCSANYYGVCYATRGLVNCENRREIFSSCLLLLFRKRRISYLIKFPFALRNAVINSSISPSITAEILPSSQPVRVSFTRV